MSDALRMSGVRKRYGKVLALDGLDLAVPRGSVCGLVGPNGAGKTTAYGVAAGLVRADAGQVELLGEGPFDPVRHKGRFALLPQDCELNPHTPVRELLRYYARLQGQTAAQAAWSADRGLQEVALEDRRDARIRQLSHGMRRRVAVAQALLGRPELVLLDEPTSGLDPHLVVHMRDVFRARARETTLLVSSHVLAELEATCDHVIFMDRGRTVRQGPIGEVTGRSTLIRVSVDGPCDAVALGLLLPLVRLDCDGEVIQVTAPAGWDLARLNAYVLPRLVAEGVRIREVQAGRSLEATYMADRAGKPA